MNLQRTVVTYLFPLLLTGCTVGTIRPESLQAQVQVFGVQLHSNRDYREINGATPSEEPCLRGYERSYDRLQISIGYGFDAHIRKISTRNPETSIFGLRPSMTFTSASQSILNAGFTPYAPPHIFRSGPYILSVQVDSHGMIVGITLETID